MNYKNYFKRMMVLPCKLIASITFFAALFSSVSLYAQTTLNTTAVSGFSNNNGSGMALFNFQNTNGYAIIITDVEGIVGTAGATTAEVWIRTTPLSGATFTGGVAVSTGWTLAASGTFTGIANTTTTNLTTQVMLTGVSINIPAGVTYAMCVTAYNGTSGRLRYHTIVSPNIPVTTISGGGCNILMGNGSAGTLTNTAFGAASAPPGLTATYNNPRAWLGKLTFVPAAGCTNPIPSPGAATATPSIPVCTGTQVTLALSGSSGGTGQTYQWFSDPSAGGSFTTAVSGVLTSPSFDIFPSSTLYYRCTEICSGGTPANSTPAQVVVNPAFPGGTYTINSAVVTGGTNYQTFAAAIAALSCGIAGPVVFNVDPASGPYNEQVIIPAIGGSSATNTITFNGNGRTITFNSTNTNERAVIKLNGADYVTLNNFIITAPGTLTTEYGFGVQLLNDADFNTVSNCTININTSSTSTTNYCGIIINSIATAIITAGASLCDNNTITSNTINGGYAGVAIVANTNTSEVNNNTVSNNIIRDFYLYGIYLNGNNNTLVEGNDISRPTRSALSEYRGVYLTANSRNCKISKNRLHNPFDGLLSQNSACFAINFNLVNASAGNENIISNNLVYNMISNQTTTNMNGMLINNCTFLKIYHNTVVLDHAAAVVTTGGTRGIYMQAPVASNAIEIRNNIVEISRGGAGPKQCIYYENSGITLSSNNNNLRLTSTTGSPLQLGFANAVGYVDLAAWKLGTSQDLASTSADPLFANPGLGNYTPTNISLDNIGTPVGILTDIIGANRSIVSPDPGAYEFSVSSSTDIGAFALITPASTGCYSDVQTVVIRVNNFGGAVDFSAEPATVTCNITGPTNATLTGTLTGILPINGSQDVTLTGTFDMSINGTYTFNAFTTCATDGNSANNAMTTATRTRAAITPGTLASSQTTYCMSGAPVLTLTGNANGSRQWQESTTSATGPWTNISGTTTYSPGTLTQTHYYRVVTSCLTASDSTNVVTVTVNNPQVLSTNSPVSLCGTGSVVLTATPSSGATINWYTASTGGLPVGAGNSFSTPVLSSSTSYWASASVGGTTFNTSKIAPEVASTGTVLTTYGQDFTVTTGFTLNSVQVFSTTGTSITIALYSSGGTTQLQTTGPVAVTAATSPTISLNWFIPPGTYRLCAPGMTGNFIRDNTGVTYPFALATIGTMNGFVSSITGAVTTSSSYYFMYNWSVSTGCESGRTQLTVNQTPGPAISASHTQTLICSGGTDTLNVTSANPGYKYTWNPGNLTGASVVVNPTSTTIYTVTAVDTTSGPNAACTAVANVTVNTVQASIAVTANPQSICAASGSTTLTLSPLPTTGASVQWQYSFNDTTYANVPSGGTGNTYNTPVLSTSTFYRAIISDANGNVCIQPKKKIIVGIPAITDTTPATRCGIGTLTLGAHATPVGSTVNWYANPTGGAPIGTGTSFNTPIISTSTNYYAAATSGGLTGSVGKAVLESTASGTGGGLTTYMNFDAISNFTLQTVVLYPYGATDNVPGTVTIELRTSTGTPIMSQTVNVIGHSTFATSVPQTVTLNFPITGGASYRLGVNAWTGGVSNLWRDATGTYPYTYPGIVSITGPSLSPYYYFFYNWSISTGCESANRSLVVATVTPAPVINVVSADPGLCQGGSTTVSVSSPNDPAYDYVWTSIPAGFNQTGSGPFTVSPSVTTTYYVSASDNSGGGNNGCAATGSVTIVTGALAGGTVSTSQSTYCVSGTPTLTVAGSGGGVLQWQQSTTSNSGPWTNVGSGTATYIPSSPVTQTTYYRTRVNCTTQADSSNVVTVTVNSPQLTSTSPATRCGIGTVTLGATTSAASINWYAAASGGTPIATGNSFTTPVITATTNYYASAVSSGGSTQISSNGVPTVTTSTQNGGLQFTLNVDVILNSIQVYSTAAGTATVTLENSANTVLYTSAAMPIVASNLSTPQTLSLGWAIPAGVGYHIKVANTGNALGYASGAFPAPMGNGVGTITSGWLGATTSTLNYFVYNMNTTSGCESSRVPVTATITPPPAMTASAADLGVCGGASTTIMVSSSNVNYTYSWSSVPAGFTATGMGPFTVTPTQTTKYYVTATDNGGGTTSGCANIDSVTIAYAGTLTAGTASASQSSYCVTGSPTISLTGSAGAIQWQKSTGSAGGPWTNIGNGSASFVPSPALTQTTYYQAVVSCQTNSLTSNVVTVTVNNPQLLSTTPGSRCGPGTVNLSGTVSGGSTINWYNVPTGGAPIGTGTTFTTPAIAATTNFYAAATDGGTTQTSSNGVPTVTTSTQNTGLLFDLYVDVTLNSIQVYSTAAGTVTVTILNSSLTTLFTSAATPIIASTLTNPQTIPLGWSIPAGTNYRILVSNTGNALGYATGVFPAPMGNGVGSITNGATATGTTTLNYFVYNMNTTAGCEGSRTIVAATVNPSTPVGINATSTTICQGSSATLSVGTGVGSYNTFAWSPSTGLSATTGTSVTATPSVTTKYYLGALNTTDQCQAIDSITIVVNTFSLSVLADNQLICGNGTVQLNANASGGIFTYAWSPATGLSSTSIANPTAALAVASQTYTVVVTNTTTNCIKSGSITLYNSNPQPPVISNVTRCGPGPVTMTATVGAGQVKWWDAPSGGNVVNIGNPYSPNITGTTNYYTSLKETIVQTPVSTGFTGGIIATDPNAAGNMFNIVATKEVKITGFDINLNNNNTLAPSNISVYYKTGTYVGFTTNPGAWTLAGTANSVTSAGFGVPTNLPLTLNLDLQAGQTYGFYIVVTNLGVSNSLLYNSSATSPAEGAVAASDLNLQVTSGTVIFGPFTGALAAPVNRMWNGKVKYSIGCESARTPVTANMTAAPVINFSGVTAKCQGSTFNLGVNSPNDPNYTYTWNPGGLTGNSISVTPNSSTIYTVTATDNSNGTNSGCMNNKTLAVTVNPNPVITSIQATPNLICGGSTPVTLTALTGTSVPGIADIGIQTTTISGNNGNPYRSGNTIGNEIHTQLLVLASELTSGGLSAGNLTSLGFTTTAAAGTVVNFTIKIGQTSLTALTTSYVNTPMTTVFTQSPFSPALGLNTHIFSTPFIWDGISNIIVDVCQQNSVLGTTIVAAYTPGYASNLHTAAVGGCSAITGTAVATKPIMRFGGSFGTSGPGTYQWQWSPGTLPSGNVATTTPTVTTIYKVTATAPGTGCFKGDSILVNVTQRPHPFFQQGDSVLCSNDAGFEMQVLDTGAYSVGYPQGTIINFYGAGGILYQNGTSSSFFNANNSDAFYAVVTLPGSIGGCDGVSDTSVMDFGTSQAPQYMLTTDSVRCYGESNGKAMAEITFGGTPRFRWQWYNSSHLLVRDVTSALLFDTLTGRPEGMYTIIITDHQDSLTSPYCSIIDSVFIGQPEAPLGVTENIVNHVNVLCFGKLTGAIDIDVSGGTPPYSFNWSNSLSTQDLSNIGAGTYTCTVTDSRGCTAVVTTIITQGAPVIVIITGNPGICAGNTNILNAGAGYSSYLWSTGATTQTISVSTANTYTVTVTIANGCTGTASVTTFVNPKPVPTISGANTVCQAGTTIISANAGFSAYSWSTGATTQSINAPGGTYTVTVTNTFGCTASASKIITITTGVPTQPGVITGPTAVCKNSNVPFSIAAVPGATGYTWTAVSGATVSTGQGSTTVVINFSNAATSATLTVVATNVCGSSVVRTLSYTVSSAIPAAPVTITGQLTGVCGQTLTYTTPVVPNATSYQWSVPANSTIMSGQGTNTVSVKFNATFTSTGTLSVYAQSGCGNSAAISKTVDARPQQPVISGQNWACKNQPGLAYSVAPVYGATSYTWTVVAGSTLVSGQGTTSIVVNWGAINGVITCKANNGCGSSLPGQKPVSFTCKEDRSLFDFSEINLYPNPASTSATIQFDAFADGEGQLLVYDMIGQQMLQEDLKVLNGNNQYNIDLNTYPKGTYIVRVIYKGFTRNCKLIVE